MKWYYWLAGAAVLVGAIVWYLYYGGQQFIANTFGGTGSNS